MPLHKTDAYLVPSFFIVLGLGALTFFSNYAITFLPKKGVYMEPTYNAGALTFAAIGPEAEWRGDRTQAVIYKAPDDGQVRVGRVIAVEGQVVEIRDRKVLVDGAEIDQSFLRGGATAPAMFPMVVPSRTLYVLADERSTQGANASDSRGYGPIPVECVTHVMSVPVKKEG